MNYLIGDAEVFKNYFLLLLKDSRGRLYRWEMHNNRDVSKFTRPQLKQMLKQSTTIGFNWDAYDKAVVYAYLDGMTNEEIFKVGSYIIEGDNLAPYKVSNEFGLNEFRYKTIDIINICPLKASLKIYGGRANFHNLQDLPFEPEKLIKNSERMELIAYCENDLDTTRAVAKKVEEEIKLRRTISRERGLNLVSKSDAQIAEALIKQDLESLGVKVIKGTQRRPKSVYKYTKPAWLKFETDIMKEVLKNVLAADFKLSAGGKFIIPKEVARDIKLGDGVYKMGIGGLHSKESNRKILRKPNEILADVDVTSYYPSIILNNKYAPEGYGNDFIEMYKTLYNRRLEAKKRSK